MKFTLAFLLCFLSAVIFSCNKGGMPEAVGGDLPTNYIILNPSGFSPVSITAVRNSTFTFVNHSGRTAGIYSSDSMVINQQGIADNTSYLFRKDTLGTIIYRLAGTPSITGSITITP